MDNSNLSTNDLRDELDILDSIQTNPLNHQIVEKSKFRLKEVLDYRELLKSRSLEFIENHISKILFLDKKYYNQNKDSLDPQIEAVKIELINIRNKGIDSGNIIYDGDSMISFLDKIVNNDGTISNLPEFDWINTQTSFFKKWFEKSKIKETNGEPKITYHGSPRQITHFDEHANGQRRRRNRGVHFSENKELTKEYSDKAKNSLIRVLSDIYSYKNNIGNLDGDIGEIRNTLILDLVENNKDSKYFKSINHGSGEIEWIEFEGNRRGTERFLEIFGGERPKLNKISKQEINGLELYTGNGIGSFTYSCYLDIKNPNRITTDHIDHGFEKIENSEGDYDGGIVVSENGIIGDGQHVIPGTQGVENYVVFRGEQIKSTSNILFGNNNSLYW